MFEYERIALRRPEPLLNFIPTAGPISFEPVCISIDWVVTNVLVVLLDDVTNKNSSVFESKMIPMYLLNL